MSPKRVTNLMREFLRLESASGLILIAMLVLAMLLANSPLSPVTAK
jgi:Na+/H+ antiporter NhaA